jgi:hypothetical protein
MKYTFSRYGGHLVILGKGKASNEKLPEDQSYQNILANHAFEMKGYSYISSYNMLPEFMGAYKNLPKGAVKIAEMDHDFTDAFFQHDVRVNSSIYFVPSGYGNVFSCFIKTDFKPVEELIGKIEPSYDLILMIRTFGKTNEQLKKEIPDFMACLLCLLIFEMELKETSFSIIPSKTYLGKQLNMDKINVLLEKIIAVGNREMLADLITL